MSKAPYKVGELCFIPIYCCQVTFNLVQLLEKAMLEPKLTKASLPRGSRGEAWHHAWLIVLNSDQGFYLSPEEVNDFW